MGILGKMNQQAKYAIRNSRMGKLAREITDLHATTPLAGWQKNRISEIRAICDAKEKKLFAKANALCQEIREEHMQFEIDFIYASREFRKDHPGEEMDLEPKGFWKSMFDKVKSNFKGEVLTIKENGQEKTI